MNELLQLLEGRRIAIVGNQTPSKDYSEEIDSADIVVRFNHFYNYDSGRVGKRVDFIFQTVAQAWYNAVNSNTAHLDVVRALCPRVFLIKKPEHYSTSVHAVYGKGIKVTNLTRLFEPWYRFTTGTAALCYLADNLKNAEVRCYGFSNEGSEAPYNQYMSTDAIHYSTTKDEERAYQLNAIKKLESLKITNTPNLIPRAIVIPIKANSEGCPGKNRKLLKPCLEKLQSLKLPIYVVGDDVELLHSVKDLCTPIPLSNIGCYDDVTVTLRRWQVETGFCGHIALVQCTSPYLKSEWVTQCFDGLLTSPITATATTLGFKPTAIFREENGVFVPISQSLPPASVARQLLPKTVKITGAVEAFHTDCLMFDSFYQGGILSPVIIEEDYSLDVDTIEDMNKIKN